jgi:hypothetical protein
MMTTVSGVCPMTAPHGSITIERHTRLPGRGADLQRGEDIGCVLDRARDWGLPSGLARSVR